VESGETLAAGRYHLHRRLGEGGMAEAWLAWDVQLQTWRAIKVLRENVHTAARDRFQREARVMARIHHPNVVAVHDVGDDGGLQFMVLEYMEAGSLSGWLKRHGALPPRLAVEVMLAVLSALVRAHEEGVVHRDIKPSNVLVSRDGVPKLGDFGIAYDEATIRALTQTGTALGSLPFASPEQLVNAKGVDRRADVYGAGALLYNLLTNRKPVSLYKRGDGDKAWKGLEPMLAGVIRRSTLFDADERWPTAKVMAQALSAALPDLPPDPPDTPPLGQALEPLPDPGPATLADNTFVLEPAHEPKRSKRSLVLVAGVLVALLALVGGVAIVLAGGAGVAIYLFLG